MLRLLQNLLPSKISECRRSGGIHGANASPHAGGNKTANVARGVGHALQRNSQRVGLTGWRGHDRLQVRRKAGIASDVEIATA